MFSRPRLDLRLRPITLDDVDHVMTWVNDPAVTRNFATLSKTITREEELAYLDQMIQSDADELMVIETSEGRYLGNVGLHQIYWPAKNARLGIVIGAKNARGRGYGTQALYLICAYGLEELGLHKLWMVHYATNGRMAHIATKLGFQQEGVLRDEYFHEDGYHDMVRRSLLEGELQGPF